MTFEGILFAFILGIVPAFIAGYKGRNFGAWYVYGVLLFPIALIHSFFLTSYIGMVKCPYCMSLVDGQATICKHCRSELRTKDV